SAGGPRHCTNVTTGRTRASLGDCGPRGMLPACGDAVAGSRLPSASSMTDTLAEIPMPVVRASYTALKTLRLRLRRAYRIVDEHDIEKAPAPTQESFQQAPTTNVTRSRESAAPEKDGGGTMSTTRTNPAQSDCTVAEEASVVEAEQHQLDTSQTCPGSKELLP